MTCRTSLFHGEDVNDTDVDIDREDVNDIDVDIDRENVVERVLFVLPW